MRCPTLNELPSPPPGRTGWPWTEASPQLPNTMVNGQAWPRISIITPSYNQGQFIEETIRSVLLQGYPDLEYIIIDGGSTDGTMEIVRKYEPWLAYWVSEQDQGQASAINKGLRRASGDIFAYLNSDDTFAPGAAGEVASLFARNPSIGVIYAHANLTDQNSKRTGVLEAKPFVSTDLLTGNRLVQPSTFMHRLVIQMIGAFDEQLDYTMDYNYWLRAMLFNVQFLFVNKTWANMRLWETSKTVSRPMPMAKEQLRMLEALSGLSFPVAVSRQQWAEASASAALWVVQVSLRAGLVEEPIEYLLHAANKSPHWVLAHRHPISAQLAKLVVEHHGDRTEEVGHRLVDAVSLQHPVYCEIKSLMLTWLHLRLADWYWEHKSATKARRHIAQGIKTQPNLLFDSHFGILFLKSLLSTHTVQSS